MAQPDDPHPTAQSPVATRIRSLQFKDPLTWLAAGSKDAMAFPAIALFFGACFWAMALALGLTFRNKPEYLMSLASGCLLIGPFLAMGLYDVSRRREMGSEPGLAASITCWKKHLGSIGLLVLVLLVLELLWGRASLVVFAVYFNNAMPSSAGVLQALLLPENWTFLMVYMGIGGIFAALVFATSVVSIPMILDKDTDAVTAAITSIGVVLKNPLVMICWGLLITSLIIVALWLPWSLGILIIGPWIGHASWHAYRASIQGALTSSTVHS